MEAIQDPTVKPHCYILCYATKTIRYHPEVPYYEIEKVIESYITFRLKMEIEGLI